MNILQHPLLQSIAKNHIVFHVEQHNFGDEAKPNMEPVVIIEGFSKSGTVMLYTDSGGAVKALARYNELNIIEDFDDLVALAYSWWNATVPEVRLKHPTSCGFHTSSAVAGLRR